MPKCPIFAETISIKKLFENITNGTILNIKLKMRKFEIKAYQRYRSFVWSFHP